MAWPNTPEFVATGTQVTNSANNVTTPQTLAPTAPTRQIGDLLLCVTEARGIGNTCTTPSGWNIITGFPVTSATASGGRWYCFTRIATSTSGAGDDASMSWASLATGTSGDSVAARIISFRYVTETLDGAFATTQDQASTNTFTINACSPSNTNSLWIGLGLRVNDTAHTFTLTAFDGEGADQHTAQGTGHGTIVGYKSLTASGSTGSSTVTPSATVSSRTLTTAFCLAARSMGNPLTIPEAAPGGLWTPDRR